MRERPEWMPTNPYADREGDIDMWLHEASWDDGAEAMAKAILERIEALASTATMCDGSEAEIALSKEDWAQLKREVLGE